MVIMNIIIILIVVIINFRVTVVVMIMEIIMILSYNKIMRMKKQIYSSSICYYVHLTEIFYVTQYIAILQIIYTVIFDEKKNCTQIDSIQ